MSAESIRRSILIVGFGAICCLFYYWGWSTEISSFGGDSAGYMMAAQYFSPYQPTSTVIEEYSQRIIYPPLFPWLLAITSGGTHILAAHLMVITFLLASFIALYHWLRIESFSPSLAAVVTLLFATLPSTRYISMPILTENVYLFFSLSSVWAVSRTNDDDSQNIFWYLAAIIIACATLTRVAAMPLLLAFGIYLLINKPRKWPLILCIASIPIAVWLLLGHQEQTGITGYTDVWKTRYSNDSSSFFWTKFIEQLQHLQRSWVGSWTGNTQSTVLATVCKVFGILSIIGLITRLRRRHFDGIYVGIYLFVILAWHSSGEFNRYAYVIYPFAIVYGYLGTSAIFYRISNSNGKHAIVYITVTGLLLLTLTPAFIIDSKLRMMQLPAEVETARQTDFWYISKDRSAAFTDIYNQAKLIEHFKSINGLVPESDCIFTIKPTVVALYTGRSSIVPPPEKSSKKEFWGAIHQCNYIYATSFTGLSYSQPFYPIQRLGKNIQIISTAENHLLNQPVPIGILAKITKRIVAK